MKTATWAKINLFYLLLFPAVAFSQSIHGDGKLSLYYDARKESLDIRFRDAHGRAIPSALQKISFFLRSPDDQPYQMDIQILDAVDAIQDHFHEPVVEIISGYRSPVYNKGLKDAGHAVANESLHMQGKAMDIHLDTATEEAVRDYAQTLAVGGVGWYPQNDFVHVDLGPTREWGHAEGKRKWVGLNNNAGTLLIRSTSNRYFRTERVLFTISPSPPTKQWTLEKFDRGTWKTVFSSNSKSLRNGHFQVPASDADKLPRGRYRTRILDSLSNEFYLKN